MFVEFGLCSAWPSRPWWVLVSEQALVTVQQQAPVAVVGPSWLLQQLAVGPSWLLWWLPGPWWVLVSEQALLVTVQQQALWLLWWALVGHCGRP